LARSPFLELAFSDPSAAGRVWRAAPVPIHAAVQFDVARRGRILEAIDLCKHLRDPAVPLPVRKACVAIGIELSAHLVHESFAELAAATLCEAVGTDDADDLAKAQQYLLWTTDKHRPEATARSLLTALSAASRYEGMPSSPTLFEGGEVSEADRLDVLLTFVDALPARLSASELETAVSLLWKADPRPQPPQPQAPIRPHVTAYPSFPRRARTLAILLSKAQPVDSQAILTRLVDGTAPTLGSSVEFLHPRLLFDSAEFLRPEDAGKLLGQVVAGFLRHQNLLDVRYFQGYRDTRGTGTPTDLERMAQALMRLAARVDPRDARALRKQLCEALVHIPGFGVTTAMQILAGLPTDLSDPGVTAVVAVNAIRTKAGVDPDLLLPAWQRLSEGLPEQPRAAVLSLLASALSTSPQVVEPFSLLAQMMAVVDGPVDPKQLEKIVAMVVEEGFKMTAGGYGMGPPALFARIRFERTANAVFAKAARADLEGTARALTGAASSYNGQANDALTIGIAQVAKSQRGKNLIIEGIKTGLAAKLSKIPGPDIPNTPSERRAEGRSVEFILRVGHALNVSYEDLGLSSTQVEIDLRSLSKDLPSYRDVDGHERHAERLRSLFELLPDADAVVAPAMGELFDHVGRGAGPADPYLIRLSPFVRNAKPAIKNRMKDAAIELAGSRAGWFQPIDIGDPVCEALRHLKADGQLQDQDWSKVRRNLVSHVESAPTGRQIQDILECARTLDLRLDSTEVVQVSQRILQLMDTENDASRQRELATAMSVIPGDLPHDVVWRALRNPLCVGEGRRTLLTRITSDKSLQADGWSLLTTQGQK
jgi:hypothetical protein